LFADLRLLIAVFYVVTVMLFVFIFSYLVDVLHVEKSSVFILIFFLTLTAAYMISKLAIDPLNEYIKELRHLSNETLHELNLPIATIWTNLSMLKKKITDEKNARRLKRIEEATQMLKQRYEELDYLIKSQTSLQIKEEFSITELLQNRVSFLQNIYPNNEIVLECEDERLIGDPRGLAKVIDNLVDNSVKYSPKNSKIILRYKQKKLQIIDEGKGIDEVELVRIFDSYYQEDAAAKGFGIGLSLVKRYCDKNDIDLTIDSTVAKGTTVELQFKQNKG